MQCSRCQQDNPAHASFCLGCGGRLALACGSCGAELPGGARFCLQCGQAVAAGTAAQARSLAPESYTPKHLAEKILTSKSALEGERKQVTVLFCDLANSTARAERLGAERMHVLLNRFFELALAEVHRYEGTINQFLGDGFMALFGAPIAHEDHARRAVLAALGIRQRLGDLAGASDAETLALRMGVNTGPVVVGTIGDNLRMDYTAVGDTTNVAARLQQLAEPGSILVSDAVARLVQGYVRLEPLGLLHAKGKTDPLLAHRVAGLGTRRSPIEGRQDRALSRFTGRDRELTTLRELLQQGQDGEGQVVGIVGEAGVGKSRLLYEFRQGLADARVTYLEGRCLSYGSAIPYLPILDIVRSNAGIADADTAHVITAKLHAALEEVSLPAAGTLPYLLQLLGIKEGTEAIATIGPETIKARTFNALRLMCLNGSRRRPLILAVEDLHWADPTSEEFLLSLVESLADAPILLVTTYRPGYRPPWIEQSCATQLALRPLAPSDSLTIVQSVLATEQVTSPLAEVILAKGEGNPFFLEELARAAVERGADAATIVLPDTVQAVLLARIDRLPATIKQLVQTAAVIGREVPARLLGETWRGPALEPLLAELKRLEFLYEQPGAGAPLLVFKHALTQQAAYESLLTPRRETLHGEIGHALEGLYSDRLEEAYALLAHHYALSANADKALEYLELANRKAMATSAMTEAHMAFVAAMNLLDAAPDTPLNRTRRLRLVTSNVTVFQMLAQLDQYMGYLKNHEQLAVELGDAALLGRLYGSQAQVEFLFGHYDRAIQLCMKAAGLCAEASHWEGAGHAYMLLEWSYLFLGQYDDVRRAREDALLALERGFNPRWYMWTLSGAALAYAWMGRWQDAESEGRKALGAAESASDESLVSFASWVLGICRLRKGDVARAVDLMDQGVSRAPTPIDKIWAQGFRGWAMCRLGKGNGEIRAVEQGVQLMQQAGFGGPSQWFMHCLGEAYVWLGEYDKARGVLRELLGLADNSARYAIGPCHRLLGEIAMQLDPGPSGLEEAARHVEEAIPLLAANGMENELALTYVAFGRVCARQGKMAAAREYLERAAEIFERLGTLNEPDRVRAALAELPPA